MEIFANLKNLICRMVTLNCLSKRGTVIVRSRHTRPISYNSRNISGGYDLREITTEQINSYILELTDTVDISPSQQNQRINAIKFYYEKVLGRIRQYYHVERPRKEKKVPTILSKEEVQCLTDRTDNLKHKCILATIYSAGLRRAN